MNILELLYSQFLPLILQGIGIVLGGLLIRATNTARDRWGIEIEARDREALHSALMTGISAALGRKLTHDLAITEAVKYTINVGAPDAVERFGLGVATLEDMARAKLRQIGADMVGISAP